MILITGNVGYIGSHVTKALLNEGIKSVGIDNLQTGSLSNNVNICRICDIRDKDKLNETFETYKPSVVFHLAALTSVPESMENPEDYIETNYQGTVNLIECMKEHNCNKLVFSSTASVYEQSKKAVVESDTLQPLNVYAKTKLDAEKYIKDQDWLNAVIFRYFNVIGFDDFYDKSKECNKTNIVPALIRSYINEEPFTVFGNKYYEVQRDNELDHSCVRDYIDVRDIALAHIQALKYLETLEGKEVFNLGTKEGYTVLELINAFEKANDIKINYTIADPRKGDPVCVVADNTKAKELLHWTPNYSLETSLKIKELEIIRNKRKQLSK